MTLIELTELTGIMATLEEISFNMTEASTGFTDALARDTLTGFSAQVDSVIGRLAALENGEPSSVVLDDIRDIGDEPGM